MNRNLNIIFSIICAILSLGVAIVLAIGKNYVIALIFVGCCILFFGIFDYNLIRKRLYLNPFNFLCLKKLPQEEIKSVLRKNLLGNGFVLQEGYYVNEKNREFDIYFCTYTKQDVSQKISQICKKLQKDDAYLLSAIEYGGFTTAPINAEELRHHLINGADRYNQPSLYTRHNKRFYVILISLEPTTESKPFLSFWMLPFNSSTKMDCLTFVDLSLTEGIARLDTSSIFAKNYSLRKEMRKIFKNVIDFDSPLDSATIRKILNHRD